MLIEICTYPEKWVPKHLADDLMLVLLARGVLPDLLTLVLCERGAYDVPHGLTIENTLGRSRGSFEAAAIGSTAREARRRSNCSRSLRSWPGCGSRNRIFLIFSEGEKP